MSQITHLLSGFGSDGAAALLSLCVLACPLRLSSVCLPLSRVVVLGHSSTLCDQLQGPLRTHSLHISYADISISKVRAAGCSPPQCQLTIEDVFRNATILHTVDMTHPSQSALSKQSVRTGQVQDERGHQLWLVCPARICPGYGRCFSGGMW